MPRALFLSLLLAIASAARGQPVPSPESEAPARISGVGATFPAPAYTAWADAARAAIGVDLRYEPKGSGAGREAAMNRAADFGASDTPMDAGALAAANLLQFPTLMGAVVVIFNVPRVRDGELKLSGPALAGIFSGRIRKWNDPVLTALNPDITLPNLSIAPVHRFEASGTSFVFTSYLSATSPDWRAAIGAGDTVPWPAGAGARGNDGVATTVAMTHGGIGYVEASFATENHLHVARLRNKAGSFVNPDAGSFAAAAAAADWDAPGFAVNMIDTPGAANWPIVAPTFILLPKDPAAPARAAAVLKFFDRAFRNGGQAAARLGYIPLPEAVQNKVRDSWRAGILVAGEPVYP